MDKYEYKHLVEQIQSLIDQGQYAEAATIADKIDWRRVRSVMTLGTISDLYKINCRYEDARDILLLAYDRKPESRQICYSLCELYIKTGEPVEAAEFYKEFEKLAPKDPGRYVLKYKLYDAYDVTLDEKIEVLEKLKAEEYQEKWMYELASLYHRRGLGTKCVEVCDELILWFGTGKYVNMAMELKMLHDPQTPIQQQKYDHRFDEEQWQAQPQQQPQYQPHQPQYQSQEPARYPSQEQPQTVRQATQKEELASRTTNEWKVSDVERANAEQFGATRVFNVEEVRQQLRNSGTGSDIDDIQVKTVDVGQYNTMNLQAEIAAGLKEVLDKDTGEESQQHDGNLDPITRVIVSPMLDPDSDSGPLDLPVIEGVEDEEELEKQEKESKDGVHESIEKSEVFFETSGEMYQDENGYFHEVSENVPEKTGEPGKGSARVRHDGKTLLEKEAMKAQPPEPMAKVLTQEADGQLRLVMPENKKLEKQITGQLSIEDIRAEWERMKHDSQAKQEEEVRQQVLRQTGRMFTEFEEAIRDNILKQMENTIDPTSFASAGTDDAQEPEAKNEGLLFESFAPEESGLAVSKEDESENEETETMAEEAAEEGKAEIREAEAVAAEAVELEEAMAEAVETEEAEAEAAETEEAEAETAETEEAEAETAETEETEAEIVEAEDTETATMEAVEAETEIVEAAGTETETMEAAEAEAEKVEKEEEEAAAEDETVEKAEPAEAEEVKEQASEAEKVPEKRRAIFGDASPKDLMDVESDWDMESILTPELSEEEPAQEEFAKEEPAREENVAEEPAKSAIDKIREALTDDAMEDDFSWSEDGIDETEATQENDWSSEEDKKGITGAISFDNLPQEEEQEGTEQETEFGQVRALTKEEEELYESLINGDSDRAQLARAIDNVSMAAYTGNVIITGDPGAHTLDLAKKMIYEVKLSDSNFSGKVAKIPGKALNSKDIAQLLDDLKNGALIVEKASDVSDQTASDLHKNLQRENFGIIVVLLDTKKNVNKFLKAHEELKPLFNARVDVQPMSNDALALFARQYAYEQEYSIDDLGMLALHTKIDEMQTANHAATTADVKEIMDDAIYSASRKTLGHFFDIILGRRYDDEDMIVITEKDFV